MVKPWLQSLSGDSHDIALEAKNLQRLENSLQRIAAAKAPNT